MGTKKLKLRPWQFFRMDEIKGTLSISIDSGKRKPYINDGRIPVIVETTNKLIKSL